jgi:hypothetical protein
MTAFPMQVSYLIFHSGHISNLIKVASDPSSPGEAAFSSLILISRCLHGLKEDISSGALRHEVASLTSKLLLKGNSLPVLQLGADLSCILLSKTTKGSA